MAMLAKGKCAEHNKQALATLPARSVPKGTR